MAKKIKIVNVDFSSIVVVGLPLPPPEPKPKIDPAEMNSKAVKDAMPKIADRLENGESIEDAVESELGDKVYHLQTYVVCIYFFRLDFL